MSKVAIATVERPVFFPAAGVDLFGVITHPTGEPNGIGLVLLTGARMPGTNRNQLFVRIGRRAALHGFHALRLDYHGVGESSGHATSFPFDCPFVDDVLAAVACLEAHGVSDIVLVGTCFGARTALAAAERIRRLSGVALVVPPVRDERAIETRPVSDYMRRAASVRALRGLTDARKRQSYGRIARAQLRKIRRHPLRRGSDEAANGVSPLFAGALGKLAKRRTPVLLAYGEEDDFYGPYRAARPRLATIMDAPGSRIEERVVPGTIHGFTRLTVQAAVAGMIDEWLTSLDAPTIPTA